MTDRPKKQPVATASPFELVVKATNDVIYDLDIELGKVSWNEPLYSHYGYPKTAAINTVEWWTSHIHPEDALRIENEITTWLEGDLSIWEAKYRFLKANGQYNYIRDRGYVIRDGAGKAVRIIGSFLDITKQHELDRAKDEFISLVSHQLRTPLTVVRTYGEMLDMGTFGKLPQKQAVPVKKMTDASIRLIELVSDILSISRLEMNAIVARPAITDVNQLISEQIDQLRPILSDKKITISFTPQSLVSSVAIDPELVAQIIHNFLTNSIRYTVNQPATIKIMITPTKDNFTISITDNGIGIPENAQEHVFQRFYRANNAENIENHGTGLGLYLVKLLAESCRGRVWFTSVESKGSTFYLELPYSTTLGRK